MRGLDDHLKAHEFEQTGRQCRAGKPGVLRSAGWDRTEPLNNDNTVSALRFRFLAPRHAGS